MSEPTESLRWKRYVYEYIRLDDPSLKYYSEAPLESQQGFILWSECNEKKIYVIFLSLGVEVIEKGRVLVDEHEKTKEFWDELCRIHETNST